jgi:hypothetical protein
VPDDAPEATDPADSAVDAAAAEVAVADGSVLPAVEPVPTSILTYAGLLLGGVVLGLFGTVLMAARVTVRGTVVPWGLILSMLAVLACVRGAAWLVGSRRGAALVGLGWVLPTLAFATTNPGGDILLPDVTRTYVYLLGSAIFVVLAVALPLPRGAAAAAADSRSHRGAARPEEPAPEPAAPQES